MMGLVNNVPSASSPQRMELVPVALVDAVLHQIAVKMIVLSVMLDTFLLVARPVRFVKMEPIHLTLEHANASDVDPERK